METLNEFHHLLQNQIPSCLINAGPFMCCEKGLAFSEHPVHERKVQ